MSQAPGGAAGAATIPAVRALATVVLLGGAAVIGCSPILVRLADTGPMATAVWRLALALPVFLVLALLGPRPTGRWRISALAAGLCFGADLACFHLAILGTSVANATLLSNLAPVAVAAGAWLLLGRPPDRRQLAGAALALLGAVALCANNLQHRPGALGGDAWGALSAVFYAAYQLAVIRARDGAGSAAVAAAVSLGGIAVALPCALLRGEALLPGTAGWGPLLALGLGVQVLGQGAIIWAARHLEPLAASTGLLLQPVVAAAIAWALFADGAVGAWQWTGGALIAAGILVAAQRQSRTSDAPGK